MNFALALLLTQATSTSMTVTVDGVERTALVFAPTSAGDHPPVVFAFHGHGGSSLQASRSFEIQREWPGAVVVYPQGLPTKTMLVDPEGKFPGWAAEASDSNRDIRFFDALYPLVMKKYGGDAQHVYAMGHSNGGRFIYTLWSARPNLFAALGSAEAAGAGAAPLTPKPIFITIGSEDQIVPPRLQRRSLSTVFKVDGSQTKDLPFGEKGSLYTGTAPVVVWNYQGTHAFPKDCVPSMIKFFQENSLPR